MTRDRYDDDRAGIAALEAAGVEHAEAVRMQQDARSLGRFYDIAKRWRTRWWAWLLPRRVFDWVLVRLVRASER